MLYFLHGTDTDKARAKALEMVLNLQKKKPEAELFRLDSDNFSEVKLEELAGSQGLFENKFIVFANRLLENKDVKETVLRKLPDIASSENVFIFLDGAVDKASLQKVTKVAKQVQVFEKAKIKKVEEFNVFSLANALRARDRKGLWVLYQKALRNNASPEALSGILFWQIKTMLGGANGKFSQVELETMARKLVGLYHNSHRGLVDFETGLEGFILTV
jgi:DNA polymerase III delta subunit